MFILVLDMLKDTLWEGYVLYAQLLSLARARTRSHSLTQAISFVVFVSRTLARSLCSTQSLTVSCPLSLTRAQKRARVLSLASACSLCLCVFASCTLTRSLCHEHALSLSLALFLACCVQARALSRARASSVCVSLCCVRASSLSLCCTPVCSCLSLSLSVHVNIYIYLYIYMYLYKYVYIYIRLLCFQLSQMCMVIGFRSVRFSTFSSGGFFAKWSCWIKAGYWIGGQNV